MKSCIMKANTEPNESALTTVLQSGRCSVIPSVLSDSRALAQALTAQGNI